MATASFVAHDTTTQGSWIGVYGADGYYFAWSSFADSPPGYVSGFDVVGELEHHWGSTTDAKGLQDPSDPTGPREALTWYSGTSFDIEFDVGATTRRVAIYSLDYDAQLRALSVSVYDADTDALLDGPRAMDTYTAGEWFVWDVTGNLRFTYTNAGGANAVASAVFFETPGGGGGLNVDILAGRLTGGLLAVAGGMQ